MTRFKIVSIDAMLGIITAKADNTPILKSIPKQAFFLLNALIRNINKDVIRYSIVQVKKYNIQSVPLNSALNA